MDAVASPQRTAAAEPQRRRLLLLLLLLQRRLQQQQQQHEVPSASFTVLQQQQHLKGPPQAARDPPPPLPLDVDSCVLLLPDVLALTRCCFQGGPSPAMEGQQQRPPQYPYPFTHPPPSLPGPPPGRPRDVEDIEKQRLEPHVLSWLLRAKAQLRALPESDVGSNGGAPRSHGGAPAPSGGGEPLVRGEPAKVPFSCSSESEEDERGGCSAAAADAAAELSERMETDKETESRSSDSCVLSPRQSFVSLSKGGGLPKGGPSSKASSRWLFTGSRGGGSRQHVPWAAADAGEETIPSAATSPCNLEEAKTFLSKQRNSNSSSSSFAWFDRDEEGVPVFLSAEGSGLCGKRLDTLDLSWNNNSSNQSSRGSSSKEGGGVQVPSEGPPSLPTQDASQKPRGRGALVPPPLLLSADVGGPPSAAAAADLQQQQQQHAVGGIIEVEVPPGALEEPPFKASNPPHLSPTTGDRSIPASPHACGGPVPLFSPPTYQVSPRGAHGAPKGPPVKAAGLPSSPGPQGRPYRPANSRLPGQRQQQQQQREQQQQRQQQQQEQLQQQQRHYRALRKAEEKGDRAESPDFLGGAVPFPADLSAAAAAAAATPAAADSAATGATAATAAGSTAPAALQASFASRVRRAALEQQQVLQRQLEQQHQRQLQQQQQQGQRSLQPLQHAAALYPGSAQDLVLQEQQQQQQQQQHFFMLQQQRRLQQHLIATTATNPQVPAHVSQHLVSQQRMQQQQHLMQHQQQQQQQQQQQLQQPEWLACLQTSALAQQNLLLRGPSSRPFEEEGPFCRSSPTHVGRHRLKQRPCTLGDCTGPGC
ncbi:hypothetical protein Esti_000851 [Eimeria stiedai]